MKQSLKEKAEYYDFQVRRWSDLGQEHEDFGQINVAKTCYKRAATYKRKAEEIRKNLK